MKSKNGTRISFKKVLNKSLVLVVSIFFVMSYSYAQMDGVQNIQAVQNQPIQNNQFQPNQTQSNQPNQVRVNQIQSRLIYAPNTQNKNAIDSIALHTYCTLSKVFSSAEKRSKCFVVSSDQSQTMSIINSIQQTLMRDRQDINDLMGKTNNIMSRLDSLPTSTTIISNNNNNNSNNQNNNFDSDTNQIKYVRGPKGKDGVGIVSSLANLDGSITLYYSDGTQFTSAAPKNIVPPANFGAGATGAICIDNVCLNKTLLQRVVNFVSNGGGGVSQ